MNGLEGRSEYTGQPLKLCFFAHLSDLGGAEKTLLELVENLITDHEADCTVVAPGDGPLILELERVGARVLPTEYAWWCTAESLPCAEMQRRVGMGLANLFLDILPQLSVADPDVICTETLVIPYGGLAAEVLGKPHIWSIREYGETGGFQFMMPWEAVAAFIKGHSDFIFGANRHICEELIPGIQPGDHDVLYPAIKAPESTQIPGRPRECGTFWICEFATIDRKRRLDIAILAVAELARRGRDVGLMIAGNRDEGHAAELKQLAQELGIGGRVEIREFVNDVFGAMAKHDALVISAPVHGLGRTAIEGMLCGIPVVYPLGTGFDDTMEDGVTGLGYAAGDAQAMADRIDLLVQDRKLRIDLGRRAQQEVRATFSREGFSGKFFRKAVELSGRQPVVRSSASTNLLEALARALDDQRRHAANLEEIISARDEEIRSLRWLVSADDSRTVDG